MGDDSPLHETTLPCGLRLRVPKRFSLNRPPDGRIIQIIDGDRHVQFNIAFLEDITAYIKALSWYEGDAMTPASPDWPEFEALLHGKEGINLRPEWENKRARAQGPFRHICSCSDRPDDWKWDGKEQRWPKAWEILKKYFPQYDRHDSIAYWNLVGADCDCLVACNVIGELDKGYKSLINEIISTQRHKEPSK